MSVNAMSGVPQSADAAVPVVADHVTSTTMPKKKRVTRRKDPLDYRPGESPQDFINRVTKILVRQNRAG